MSDRSSVLGDGMTDLMARESHRAAISAESVSESVKCPVTRRARSTAPVATRAMAAGHVLAYRKVPLYDELSLLEQGQRKRELAAAHPHKDSPPGCWEQRRPCRASVGGALKQNAWPQRPSVSFGSPLRRVDG
jgi:hypothetical protein